MLRLVRERAFTLFDVPHDGSVSICDAQISLTLPEKTGSHPDSPSIGLHVDQNNGNEDRFCTVLVYLNGGGGGGTGLVVGGSTVWPCVPAAGSGGNRAAPAGTGRAATSAPPGFDVADVDTSGNEVRLRDVAHAGAHLLSTGATSTSDAVHLEVGQGEVEVSLVPGSVAAAV